MLAPGKHYVNAPIRLTARLQDDAGNTYDPTTVTLKTKDPWGIEASYVYGTDDEITRISAGLYAGDVTPDKAGNWAYRWETTGGVIAFEGEFLIQRSRFFCDDAWPSSDYAY